MLANAVAVTDDTFEQEVERSKSLTILDFSATWCPPCRLLEPILDEIATERGSSLKVANKDGRSRIITP